MKKLLFVFICLLAWSTKAFSEVPETYIGANFHAVQPKYPSRLRSPGISSCMPEAHVYGGIKINRYFGAELGYRSLISSPKIISLYHYGKNSNAVYLKTELVSLKGVSFLINFYLPIEQINGLDLLITSGIDVLKANLSRSTKTGKKQYREFYATGLQIGAGAQYMLNEQVGIKGILGSRHPHFFNGQESSLETIFAPPPRLHDSIFYTVGMLYKF
jgi:opacity protein-like surface antigen